MEKDDQNPSQGLPKGSKSPLYGRAVAPALPAQFRNYGVCEFWEGLVRGPRHPPRQPPSRLFFHHFFRPNSFLPKSFPRPFQGTSQGLQIHQKSYFLQKKSSPGPYFYRRFGRSIFSILFGSIFNAFSSKIDEKTGNYCTAAPFFLTSRPLR